MVLNNSTGITDGTDSPDVSLGISSRVEGNSEHTEMAASIFSMYATAARQALDAVFIANGGAQAVLNSVREFTNFSSIDEMKTSIVTHVSRTFTRVALTNLFQQEGFEVNKGEVNRHVNSLVFEAVSTHGRTLQAQLQSKH